MCIVSVGIPFLELAVLGVLGVPLLRLENNCCTVKIVSVHKGGQEVQQENSSGMGSDVKGFGEKNMFGWFFFVLLWVYVLCFLF